MAIRGNIFTDFFPDWSGQISCSPACSSLFRRKGIAAQSLAFPSGIRSERRRIAKLPCQQGIYGNGPKAGGGIRRFEAAS
jgi:hypothetical protein